MHNKATSKSIGTSVKRLPGQALREERDKLFDKLVNDPAVLMFVGWVVLVIECLHIFGGIQPSLWLGIPIAIVYTVYAISKIYKARRELRKYRRGEEGERIVAQAIEQDLIPAGYIVFHDIPLEKDGRRFNIDHLLIGPNGIFAIETKNYSKPTKGSPEVKYDGTELLWNGVKHKNRDEIVQAKSAALSAKALILELTGINVYVHPVLCAVGWFAKSTNLYGHPVLLTMEKTLKSTIPNVVAKQGLSEEDRNKIVSAIKRNAQ